MDSADSIGVYGEAKAEYTRQLCIFLVPALEEYFLDLLKETKEKETDTRRVLWVFQDSLKQFPEWNVDKVLRETEKIITATKCDYLEEILTAVFIAHTKVLSAIRLTSRQKKLQITIPKLDHFLHRTMSECARLLWSNAYLFSENATSVDRQKNLRQVEQLLQEGVLQSIRGMLPVKSILKEYLADDGDDFTTEGGNAEGGNGESSNTDGGNAEGSNVEAAADNKEEDIAPVVHESDEHKVPEGAEAVVAALQEVPKPEAEEEEKKEVEAPVENQEVVKVEEAAPVVTDAPSSQAPVISVTEPTIPTIVVNTEVPIVDFTKMDAVFDSEDPEKNTIQLSASDEDAYADGIEIDESAPPEDVDDFESLEAQNERDETIAFEEDEFETL